MLWMLVKGFHICVGIPNNVHEVNHIKAFLGVS